jgi:Penicillin amidase
MAVELTPDGPRTRTILTYSQWNPASPHYRDQTVLFSRKQWVMERFTETEIDADPHLQTPTVARLTPGADRGTWSRRHSSRGARRSRSHHRGRADDAVQRRTSLNGSAERDVVT